MATNAPPEAAKKMERPDIFVPFRHMMELETACRILADITDALEPHLQTETPAEIQARGNALLLESLNAEIERYAVALKERIEEVNEMTAAAKAELGVNTLKVEPKP